MQTIVREYVRRCEKAGREPDEGLLGPVMEVFERLQAEAGEGGPA